MKRLKVFRITLVSILLLVAVLPIASQELKAPKISGLINARYAWSDKEHTGLISDVSVWLQMVC